MGKRAEVEGGEGGADKERLEDMRKSMKTGLVWQAPISSKEVHTPVTEITGKSPGEGRVQRRGRTVTWDLNIEYGKTEGGLILVRADGKGLVSIRTKKKGVKQISSAEREKSHKLWETIEGALKRDGGTRGPQVQTRKEIPYLDSG